MKIYTVQELIDSLERIEDKSLEVYVRGDNNSVIPCDAVIEASGDGDMVVLACDKDNDTKKAVDNPWKPENAKKFSGGGGEDTGI